MKALLRGAYRGLPFKKTVYSLLRKVWTPPERVFRHLHFNGIFPVRLPGGRQFRLFHPGHQIENEIFWRGIDNCWEKRSLAVWMQLCRNAETVVDIGANTGVYALVAKAVNPTAAVHAFEPHADFCALLRKNVQINRFDIVVHQTAVSDTVGVRRIDDYSRRSDTIEVQSVTLDVFIEKHGIRRIDLLKIDVEKHEVEVLRGFSKYLPLFRPAMIIEILDERIADEVFSLVKDLGYHYYNIDEQGGIRKTDGIEKSDYYNYLLTQRPL